MQIQQSRTSEILKEIFLESLEKPLVPSGILVVILVVIYDCILSACAERISQLKRCQDLVIFSPGSLLLRPLA